MAIAAASSGDLSLTISARSRFLSVLPPGVCQYPGGCDKMRI